MKLLFAILFQCLGLIVWAKDKPDWVTSSVKSDPTYKFYVGRASNVAGDSSAISQATKDAYEQAHRENFGTEVQINSETYQTNSNASSVVRISEKSKAARFESFEQKGYFIEDAGNGRSNAWVLYSFAKDAIEKERTRLKNIPNSVQAENLPFSTQGSTQDQSKGILQITTDPQGAAVYVDGERYGKTPLQLNGQLAEGQHKIRIDHPQFETVEEDFIIGRNQTIKINKTLVRSSGTVKFKVDVPNASVIVDGQPVGTTPITDLKVEAGVKHKVEITHAETEKYSQEFEVSKGDVRNLDINLPKKPSYLSLSTNPNKASVMLGDQVFQSPIQKLQLKDGIYKIEIKKDDFVTYTSEIVLLGGEFKVIPLIQLTPVSEELKRLKASRAEEQHHLKTNPWKLGLWLGTLGAAFKDGEPMSGFSFTFEKKFYGWFGLRLSYQTSSISPKSEGSATFGTANSTMIFVQDQKATLLSVAIPIYFYRNFYVAPEYGKIDTKLSLKSVSYNSSGVAIGNSIFTSSESINQTFSGAVIGYEWDIEHANAGWDAAWSLELGMRSYSSASTYTGATPFIVKAGILVTF